MEKTDSEVIFGHILSDLHSEIFVIYYNGYGMDSSLALSTACVGLFV